MPLSAGTRLGPYEIIAPLGAGGPPSFARISRANYGEVRRSQARGRDESR
jgi:hypothetical protein